MSFPPVFSNVWDITQPPDTENANLLGQNLRTLRNDVMQRMSLLSGVIGNIPAPETVNAVWGGSGFGLMYFSTDTGQFLQWNGTVWVDVTQSFHLGNLKYSDTTIHVFNNPSSQQQGSGIVIPAGTLKVGSAVTIDTYMSNTQEIPTFCDGYTLFMTDGVGSGNLITPDLFPNGLVTHIQASFVVSGPNNQIGGASAHDEDDNVYASTFAGSFAIANDITVATIVL